MDTFVNHSRYTVHRVDNILAGNDCSCQRNAFHPAHSVDAPADDVFRRDTAGPDPQPLLEGR